ncbi:PDZ domain-containing protein [Arthrobacter cheniae]|uniref:PDZ domain-containing protein n=1 Tax=Arthrobacter cheniae TaxID=1258888 RepID=A0A3A5LYU8_9MICC|nr:trypsin-like peptidase domain-containing protein [Arthrobacter cheniae]RJT77783.1 PDZ domain-containing protein [Arthrobacter cheniae]
MTSRTRRPRCAMTVGLALLFTVSGCTLTDSADSAPSAPAQVQGESGSPSAPAPSSGSADAEQGDMSIPDIVEAVEPSVVTIFTENGLGSGVIYTEDGLILTNEHVIRGNDEVEVAFADGQRVSGTVESADAVSDLALVRADRTDLPAATFQSNLPRIGELAVVIGSPLGFENTATSGIISGLHREIPGSASTSQSLVDLIQTDAAISPGNSGGAVVNGRGEIIGISEAYIPPARGAVALGFAIPAPTATEVAEELREDGTAEHAYMGLAPGAITPQIAERLNLQDATGVVVLSVSEGGPADDAGIRPGDIITKIGGDELSAPEGLLSALRQREPGDSVTVETRRGSETQTVEVRLSDRPAAEG